MAELTELTGSIVLRQPSDIFPPPLPHEYAFLVRRPLRCMSVIRALTKSSLVCLPRTTKMELYTLACYTMFAPSSLATVMTAICLDLQMPQPRASP
jgi:hypothetical protein